MAGPNDDPVRLKRPTDFEILGRYLDGENDNAANTAEALGRKRTYINTRLPELDDYGLLEKVGPSPNSGLYRITPAGVAAYRLRDEYSSDDFEEQVEALAKEIEVRRPGIIEPGRED